MYVELVDETGQVPSEIIEQTKEVLAFAAKKLNLKESTEMSVTFVDNARSHELNLQYRETDRPTDVISLEYKPDESEFLTSLRKIGSYLFSSDILHMSLSVEDQVALKILNNLYQYKMKTKFRIESVNPMLLKYLEE